MNNNDILIQYANLAFSLIVASTPVDTRNLLNNTTMEIGENYAIINIKAPLKTNKGMSDYAVYVNYNRQRSFKERKNYHYVENALIQAAKIIAESKGGVVNVI